MPIGDVIAAGIIIVGGIAIGIDAIFGSPKANITISTALNPAVTEKRLSDIAKDFGNKQCVDAADAMAKELTRLGHTPLYVEIMFDIRQDDGGIVKTISGGDVFSPGEVISESGYHVGIKFNNTVYCNVHPSGIPLEAWFNDFSGKGIPKKNYGSPTPMVNMWLSSFCQ